MPLPCEEASGDMVLLLALDGVVVENKLLEWTFEAGGTWSSLD
jgi:hypothetical protein